MYRKRSYRRPYRRRRFRRKRVGRRRRVNPGYNTRYGGQTAIKIRRSFNALNLQGNTLYTPYVNAGNQTGFNLYRLTDLVKSSELTDLFNEYMFVGVKYEFKIRRSVQQGNTGASNGYMTWPTMYYNVDTTGSNMGVTGLSDLLEKSTMRKRTLTPEKPFSLFVRPRISDMVYGGSTGVTYASTNAPQWCSTKYPQVNHYGLQWTVDEFQDTGNFIDCVVTYYLKFRGVC